jgi:hypothetical protein
MERSLTFRLETDLELNIREKGLVTKTGYCDPAASPVWHAGVEQGRAADF